MADILIRGMEMPKNGESTTITVYGDGVWCAYFDNEPHGKAGPLPEKHGRLGDLNAMYRQLHSLYHGAISDSKIYVYEVLGMISNAPTIISAEGGGVEDYPTYLDCPKPKKPPQDRPLCDTCKHAIDGVVDDFATVFCTVRQGYFGQVTECKDYKDKRGGGDA